MPPSLEGKHSLFRAEREQRYAYRRGQAFGGAKLYPGLPLTFNEALPWWGFCRCKQCRGRLAEQECSEEEQN